jgi:hypothetical protein
LTILEQTARGFLFVDPALTLRALGSLSTSFYHNGFGLTSQLYTELRDDALFLAGTGGSKLPTSLEMWVDYPSRANLEAAIQSYNAAYNNHTQIEIIAGLRCREIHPDYYNSNMVVLEDGRMLCLGVDRAGFPGGVVEDMFVAAYPTSAKVYRNCTFVNPVGSNRCTFVEVNEKNLLVGCSATPEALLHWAKAKHLPRLTLESCSFDINRFKKHGYLILAKDRDWVARVDYTAYPAIRSGTAKEVFGSTKA